MNLQAVNKEQSVDIPAASDIKISAEVIAYTLLILVALVLRLANLGIVPMTDVEAVQFAMWMRSMVNQHMRVRRLEKLGLYTRAERLPSVEQLAEFMSTPGGKQFLESNEIFPKDLLDDIQPYLGQEPKSDFILGRDGFKTE